MKEKISAVTEEMRAMVEEMRAMVEGIEKLRELKTIMEGGKKEGVKEMKTEEIEEMIEKFVNMIEIVPEEGEEIPEWKEETEVEIDLEVEVNQNQRKGPEDITGMRKLRRLDTEDKLIEVLEGSTEKDQIPEKIEAITESDQNLLKGEEKLQQSMVDKGRETKAQKRVIPETENQEIDQIPGIDNTKMRQLDKETVKITEEVEEEWKLAVVNQTVLKVRMKGKLGVMKLEMGPNLMKRDIK